MASDRGSCEKEGPLTAAGVARLADAEGAGLAGEEGWVMPDYPGSGPKRETQRERQQAPKGSARASPAGNRGVGRNRFAAMARHSEKPLRILQGLHADGGRLRLHRTEDGGERHV